MIPPQLLIGTFQNNKYEVLLSVVDAAVKSGFCGFDTAPSYGTQFLLGKAIQECKVQYNLHREDIYLSDKIDAWQMMKFDGDVRRYVENALCEIDTDYIDIVWIHWPITEYLDNTWKSLNQLKDEGLILDIGISNVRERHLKAMALRNIVPQNIQIERHPLRTCDAEIEYCRMNKIRVFSYSPICRMHPDLKNSQILQVLSKKYNKNIGQIVLRWHIDTGSIPIFMSKSPKRVLENLDIFNFKLSDLECDMISSLNQNYKIFLESWGCPGF